jgi:hypothetical protein
MAFDTGYLFWVMPDEEVIHAPAGPARRHWRYP